MIDQLVLMIEQLLLSQWRNFPRHVCLEPQRWSNLQRVPGLVRLGVFSRACGQQKLEGAGGAGTTEEASKVED